jgi:hypothetical protein
MESGVSLMMSDAMKSVVMKSVVMKSGVGLMKSGADLMKSDAMENDEFDQDLVRLEIVVIEVASVNDEANGLLELNCVIYVESVVNDSVIGALLEEIDTVESDLIDLNVALSSHLKGEKKYGVESLIEIGQGCG